MQAKTCQTLRIAGCLALWCINMNKIYLGTLSDSTWPWPACNLLYICCPFVAYAKIRSMAQQVAGYAYWISALVAQSGHPVRAELPKEKRRLFRELARLLLSNDFDDLSQLKCSPDPSEWIGMCMWCFCLVYGDACSRLCRCWNF